MKNIIRSFIIVIASLSLNSCLIGRGVTEIKARKTFTVENGAIPSEFGRGDTKLMVILKGRKGYDRQLRKALKSYGGNYFMVTKSKLRSARYMNKEKYRYIFDYSNGKTIVTYYDDGRITSTIFKRFYVKDRVTNEIYKCNAEFNHFGIAMRVYIENLNLKRFENQIPI